jgi:hypothetical protein
VGVWGRFAAPNPTYEKDYPLSCITGEGARGKGYPFQTGSKLRT